MSVKINEMLEPAAIVVELQGGSKAEVLAELTDALLAASPELNRSEVLRVLQERERLGSTGIGEGVAIPHGKLKNLSRQLIAFGLSRAGVEFDAMDGKPAHLFFLLIAPEDAAGAHLKTLARISKLLKGSQLRERLHDARDQRQIHQIISEEEEKL
jgi:PTS system nitrogen regulatory IIA component